MTESPARARWHRVEDGFLTLFRNVSTRYAGIAVNVLLGLVVLPINLHYLGASAYGLWMLTATITAYFSAFDLGYGGTIVRFVAEYRARRDVQALNEVLSTMFFLYTGIGLVVYAAAIGLSFAMPYVFALSPEQAEIGQIILLIIAANVTLHFVFSVFGGVINGFESYYLNNIVGTGANILAAVVNVIVVMAGYGLIELVTATTLVRIAPYFLYRHNAYRVFPALNIRWQRVSRERLRQLTGFSIYLAIIDWSSRLNYTVDTLMIGAFMSTGAVAVYAVAQRLSEALFRLTHQLHVFLFPAVVHRSVAGTVTDQQRLMVRATRFQTAAALAICGAVAAAADRLVPAWVGSGYEPSVLVLQLLVYVVVLRAWMGMPGTVLKGTGGHRFLAATSAVCAVANILLTVLLVKPFGLIGVALGTVIPVSIMATAVVFPAACRTLHLSTWSGYRQIVWPAVWPAAIVMLLVAETRFAVPVRILAVLAHVGVGALAYAGLFFAGGLDREERQWIVTKVTELWKRRGEMLAAA